MTRRDPTLSRRRTLLTPSESSRVSWKDWRLIRSSRQCRYLFSLVKTGSLDRTRCTNWVTRSLLPLLRHQGPHEDRQEPQGESRSPALVHETGLTQLSVQIAITAGVGSDHVDLDAANTHKITVAEVTGSNVVSYVLPPFLFLALYLRDSCSTASPSTSSCRSSSS